ncbi:hypothetical protein [Halopseudomonas salegens]|uniref:Uncharacterized protein n=1 Tax=Halopseudomonas salegens TaxID=1434072 RepID=A0A1H2E603_9GAMM|nr:hypothetical protein [Halopseudomonas salegens]SDT90510.1 hypothetical protein SAMN05216210_0370 [Halopseudomonas salegens]
MFTHAQPETSHLDAVTREQLDSMLCRSLDDSTTSLHRAQTLSAQAWPADLTNDNASLTLLSLSSYQFHSLVLVITDSTRATCEVTDDHLLEMGNTFCGSLKRQLGQHLPNLGMSTPHALSVKCLPTLLDSCRLPLVAGCHDSRGLSITGWLLLPKDFELQLVTKTVDDAESTGELELF